MERKSLDYVLNYVESMPTQIGRTTAFRFFILLSLQVNGTQLAGCNDYGTIIVWSYPSGEILFQADKQADKRMQTTIKWNPFSQDIFAVLREDVKSP